MDVRCMCGVRAQAYWWRALAKRKGRNRTWISGMIEKQLRGWDYEDRDRLAKEAAAMALEEARLAEEMRLAEEEAARRESIKRRSEKHMETQLAAIRN